MRKIMTDKKDTNDFDFEDSNDFNFGADVTSNFEEILEKDIKAANNLRENVIKKQNTINEKEVERRAIEQAKYEKFTSELASINDPYDLEQSHQIFYFLSCHMDILSDKTFWAFDSVEHGMTETDQIMYFTWAHLAVSKSTIDNKLKLLIMDLINSYIAETVYGKLAWKIVSSL